MQSMEIASGVFVVLLIVAALYVLTRRGRRTRDRMRAQGLSAEAEVLDVWQDGMGSFCVRYRYTPQGSARPITRDEFAGCLRATLPDVGDRVSVRYDPEAPERARLQRDGC